MALGVLVYRHAILNHMNYCPRLISLLKDACACISQMSHRVSVWQNTDKERARYQNFPKSGALAYLHHESDYRTAMPVVVCPQRGPGGQWPHSSELQPVPTSSKGGGWGTEGALQALE